jgi:hypothetical protein
MKITTNGTDVMSHDMFVPVVAIFRGCATARAAAPRLSLGANLADSAADRMLVPNLHQ